MSFEVNQGASTSKQASSSKQTSSSKQHRGKGKGWTVDEDRAICRAWLDVSQDPITSVNQKADTMYSRVLKRFLEIRQMENCTGDPRTQQSVKSRWQTINRSVSKFVGNVSTAQNENKSGSSLEDVLNRAYELYSIKEKANFGLLHCYQILENAPKWMQQAVKESPIKRNESFEIAESEQPNLIVDESLSSGSHYRPIGQKRAKLELAQANSMQSILMELADSGAKMAEVSRMKLHDSQKRTNALECMVNHKIMRVDMDKLTPTAQHYYGLMQARILRALEANVSAETNEEFPNWQASQTMNGYERDHSLDDLARDRVASPPFADIDESDQVNEEQDSQTPEGENSEKEENINSNRKLETMITDQELDELNISYSDDE